MPPAAWPVGRQEAIQDPLGNRVTTVFDSVGRVAATVDPLAHRTSYVYDALNRQIAVEDSLNGRTTTVFDAVGNVVNIIDPVGNKTTFVFDAVNRKTEETDPLGETATFAYDAAGYMSSTTDRIGRRRDFAFDDAGRQTGEVWYSWPSVIETNRLTFTYDAAGNQLSARDGDGAYTLTYDALNRVATSVDMWGKVLTMAYDAGGNRTQLQDSDGGTTDSTFDALGRLTHRKYTESATVKMSVTQVYDAAGRTTEQWRYGESYALVARTSLTYDAGDRLTNLQHRDGSANNIANYTYVYDNAGRLTSEEKNGTTATYVYDNTDQLTADGNVTVTYDANGNRNNGSYTTGTGNRMTADGTWTYTWDDEGNLLKRSQGASALTWTYVWDEKNELVQVKRSQTDGGAVDLQEDLKYDVYGNRIEKSYDADGAGGGGATVTRFAYDAWKNSNQYLVGNENWDVWADLSGSSSLTTRYLRGDVIDQVFARSDMGAKYWTLTDRLGSVRDVVNSGGTIKDTIAYNGFAGIISESDSNFRGRYAWSGREIEAEIELQYNRARWYDANSGRWISQDPLGFDAGDSNLYRYLKNCNSNAVDPSGLDDDLTPDPLLKSSYKKVGAVDLKRLGVKIGTLWVGKGTFKNRHIFFTGIQPWVIDSVDGIYISVSTTAKEAKCIRFVQTFWAELQLQERKGLNSFWKAKSVSVVSGRDGRTYSTTTKGNFLYYVDARLPPHQENPGYGPFGQLVFQNPGADGYTDEVGMIDTPTFTVSFIRQAYLNWPSNPFRADATIHFTTYVVDIQNKGVLGVVSWNSYSSLEFERKGLFFKTKSVNWQPQNGIIGGMPNGSVSKHGSPKASPMSAAEIDVIKRDYPKQTFISWQNWE